MSEFIEPSCRKLLIERRIKDIIHSIKKGYKQRIEKAANPQEKQILIKAMEETIRNKVNEEGLSLIDIDISSLY